MMPPCAIHKRKWENMTSDIIGFIGFGSMARAITKGIRTNEKAMMIFASARHHGALQDAALPLAVHPLSNNIDLVKASSVIVLATKPQQIDAVMAEIAPYLAGKTLVSIAAGTPIEKLETLFGHKNPAIIRAMPNVNLSVGEGMTALCANSHVLPETMHFVRDLFSYSGQVIEIAEKDFGIFSAIAGCAPAFVFLLAEALAKASVKYGLSKADAAKIIAQMILGSGTNLVENGQASLLIDRVCSPGGTTIAGILALEEAGLPSALVKAVDAVIARDHAISLGKAP